MLIADINRLLSINIYIYIYIYTVNSRQVGLARDRETCPTYRDVRIIRDSEYHANK